MEKNRLRPMRIPGSNNIRMSYARQKDVLDMPNLIEVQKNSYQWFLTDGLRGGVRRHFSDYGLQRTAQPGIC